MYVKFFKSAVGLLLVFHHKNKCLLGSSHFIIVMDINDQKTHNVRCPNQNFQWERKQCQDMIIGISVQNTVLTVCTAYHFRKITRWSDLEYKSMLCNP